MKVGNSWLRQTVVGQDGKQRFERDDIADLSFKEQYQGEFWIKKMDCRSKECARKGGQSARSQPQRIGVTVD